MGKVKTIYRILVPVLVVLGMALSPFPAMETAEASSVSSAWVELSDDTVLNSTSTALEYVVHFTTTTALSGGKDTVTIFFPNGTTDMAGEEGSGYAFTLPGSIDNNYVAVDPDGALTTTTGYTDCYTNPDVGTYRVRLTVPSGTTVPASASKDYVQVDADYTLSPCHAIYIKMNAADSILLKYNATDISLPTKQLYAGWNLIGLASLMTKHVDDAVQSVANTPDNLPGYSQVISPSMNSEDWTFSYGQSYTDEDMLVGEGYWIYMQNDCTLVGFTVTPIELSLD